MSTAPTEVSSAQPPAVPPPKRRRTGAPWWLGGLLIVAALVAGLIAVNGDPGYVLVNVGQISVETSFWFALVALVLAYLCVRAFGVLWRALFGANGWWRQRQTRRARARTTQGMLAFQQGDWAAARKSLLANVTAVDDPAVNLIYAARAAYAEGDSQQAELYLRQAETGLPVDQPAAALVRLEQMLDAGGEPPITELQQLRDRAPRSPGVLRALAVALERGEQWQLLRGLVADLRKQQALAAPALTELERRIWKGVAKSSAGLPELQRAWGELSRTERADAAYVLAYAMALHRFGADAEAESQLRESLANAWQHQHVTLYGLLRADSAKQLRQIDQWLAQHPDDGALLQASGRLHAAAGNWQQARNAFNAAAQVLARRGATNWGASAQQVNSELAEALLQLGDTAGALSQLRAPS